MQSYISPGANSVFKNRPEGGGWVIEYRVGRGDENNVMPGRLEVASDNSAMHYAHMLPLIYASVQITKNSTIKTFVIVTPIYGCPME